MSRAKQKAKGQAIVVREKSDVVSVQPRFQQARRPMGVWWSQLCKLAEMTPPAYLADSMNRDLWLSNVWRLEPHLAGVINAVTLIDSNRGWELTGGRNQVNRYTDMLHACEAGKGWRVFARKASLAYWTTDLGSVTEVGRDGKNGPVRALYNVDSARCRLTGDPQLPLEYSPTSGGGFLQWSEDDYFRICSMPASSEGLADLGFCAVSRAIEVIRTLYAVMLHDQEKLAARAPRGLLLLKGITQDQWDDSLKAREEDLDSLERAVYGGVQTLASGDADMSATLVGLSQLPDHFDAEKFLNLSMYAMALCVGYDPSEFWPVNFGALGRGTETEVMHQKATAKGGLDFAYGMQEQLQNYLPETLAFEFAQRDDAGELARVAVEKAKWDKIIAAYAANMGTLITREEARILAAEEGLIPEEWTEAEEDVTATDTEDADDTEAVPEEQPVEPLPEEEPPVPAERKRRQERVLSQPMVQRAMVRFPAEDIVRYSWPSREQHVIYHPKRRIWPVERKARATVYESPALTITDKDMKEIIDEAIPEVRELLTAPIWEESGE